MEILKELCYQRQIWNANTAQSNFSLHSLVLANTNIAQLSVLVKTVAGTSWPSWPI